MRYWWQNSSRGLSCFPVTRAHRIGIKPTDEGRRSKPRVFLVHFHYFQDKHHVSRQRQELDFRGSRVFFHNDSSAEQGRKRAAFRDVKSLHYKKGIRFGLLHPARLQVIHDGKIHYFDSPEAAKKFYDSHRGKQQEV